MEQQEVTGETLTIPSLLFLRHPDIQSDVWATPPVVDVVGPLTELNALFETPHAPKELACIGEGIGALPRCRESIEPELAKSQRAGDVSRPCLSDSHRLSGGLRWSTSPQHVGLTSNARCR